jgi:PhnB protein
MTVSSIAEGYNSVTAFFHVRDAERLIAFLRTALGAEETQRTMDAGRVVHAEVSIGNSRVMIGEPWAQQEIPWGLQHAYVYVEDVDVTFRRALQAGGTRILEPGDQFWGDRLAGVEDPCGIRWWIATHTRDVAPPPARHW